MSELIGTLREQPLHAGLKEYYAHGEGGYEVNIDGYFIDVIVDRCLIEIQTGNFSSIKTKLYALTKNHSVKLVYPVAVEKWLIKLPGGGLSSVEKRKSPKRGVPEQVFEELVSFPDLLANSNFTLELAMIQEEEVRKYSSENPWRQRGWATVERRLIKVLTTKTYKNPGSMQEFLPETLPDKFTTLEIAKLSGISRRLAQKMAYCLRKMGCIQQVGKKGRNYLYVRF